MIQTLPLNPDDVAVTHLPGDVTVSTRAITHVGIRPGEEITNYETMILIPGGHVDGPDTRDRALAVGQHISVVSALLGGAALSSIGLVAMDEPDGRTERLHTQDCCLARVANPAAGPLPGCPGVRDVYCGPEGADLDAEGFCLVHGHHPCPDGGEPSQPATLIRTMED